MKPPVSTMQMEGVTLEDLAVDEQPERWVRHVSVDRIEVGDRIAPIPCGDEWVIDTATVAPVVATVDSIGEVEEPGIVLDRVELDVAGETVTVDVAQRCIRIGRCTGCDRLTARTDDRLDCGWCDFGIGGGDTDGGE